MQETGVTVEGPLFVQTIAVGDPKDRHSTHELDELISRLAPCGLIEHLGRIAVEFAETPHNYLTDYQISLIDRYAHSSPLSEEVARKLRDGEFTHLTTPLQISNLILYIIARVDPHPQPYDRDSIPGDGSFLTLLTLFNYYGLIDPDAHAFYFQANALQNEFSQIPNMGDRFLNHSYRYLQLLEWSESDAARTSKNSLPIKADLENALAMPYLDYAAASWLVEAYYTEAAKLLGTSYPWLRINEYFLADANLTYITSFVRQNSFNRDDLLKVFEPVTPRRLCSEGFIFSLRHPLYIADDAYLLINKASLDNTLGAGLFFRLFDTYKVGGGDRHLQLTRLFGEFFESYIYDAMQRIGRQTKMTVFREQHTDGERSTDIVLFKDETAVFAEVYSGRVPTEAIQSGAPAAIQAAIDKCVFKKAKQLDRNISNFRNGKLTFDGVDAGSVTRIYPLIIMPHGFPRSGKIQATIDKKIADSGWLQGTNGLEIIESETLEALEEHLNTNLTLPSLLDKKLSSADTRNDSFKNFLIRLSDFKLRIGKAAQERLDKWVAEIRKTAEEWAPGGKIFK